MNHLIVLKLIAAMALSSLAGVSLAYTQCEKSPKNIWQDFNNSSADVWICFQPGNGGCIYKSLNSPNMDGRRLNNFYAMGLAAVTTGRKLSVRYPEDNYNCASTASRGDITGAWLK